VTRRCKVLFRGERYHGEVIEGWHFESRGQSYIEQIELSPVGELEEMVKVYKDEMKKCIVDPLTWTQGYNVTYKCPHCGCSLFEKDMLEKCGCCKKDLDWSQVNQEQSK
jgi:hypothetical protein